MMGFWQPVTNLKDYVSQNPPSVTFFLCLLSLAISFICLSAYSYTHILPNPDTEMDWNHLLSSLSEFQLCPKTNSSPHELVSAAPSTVTERGTSLGSTKTYPVSSLRLRVPLTSNSNSGSLKDLSLHTTLRAEQLHLGGNEIVDMTLEVLLGNDSHTCLTISAPTHLLPMSLLPPACPASERNISTIPVDASIQAATASQSCYSLQYKNDPTLTVMLTRVHCVNVTSTTTIQPAYFILSALLCFYFLGGADCGTATSVGSQCVSIRNLFDTLCRG